MALIISDAKASELGLAELADDERVQLLSDAAAIYDFVRGAAIIDEDAVRAWAQGAMDVERVNAALTFLRACDLISDLPTTLPLVPATLEQLTVSDLQAIAKA